MGVARRTVDDLADLQSEFAGGSDDQRLDALVGGRALEQRQYERRRLAGTGLGDADDIAPGEHLGDGFTLDRTRRGVAESLDARKQARLKAEGFERHMGLSPVLGRCLFLGALRGRRS